MVANEIRTILKKTCELLNKHHVDYMIIGGTAVGIYGYQRMSGGGYPGVPELTYDIDFWYKPTLSNYHNLVNSLNEMGINTEKLENIVFNPNKAFLRIPHEGFKTEFLPKLDGLESFSESKKSSKIIHLDGNDLPVISYGDLIKNKQAVNREIDRIDIQELGKINKNKGRSV